MKRLANERAAKAGGWLPPPRPAGPAHTAGGPAHVISQRRPASRETSVCWRSHLGPHTAPPTTPTCNSPTSERFPTTLPQCAIPNPPVTMMSKLYVGNLPTDVNEGTLRQLFSEQGVNATNVLVKRGGYAFVDCQDQTGIDRAIQELNGRCSRPSSGAGAGRRRRRRLGGRRSGPRLGGGPIWPPEGRASWCKQCRYFSK